MCLVLTSNQRQCGDGVIMQLWLVQQENTGTDELGDDMAERVLCSSLGC